MGKMWAWAVLGACLAGVGMAQVSQDAQELSPAEVVEVEKAVAEAVQERRHPLLKLAPKTFKRELKTGRIRLPQLRDIENKTVAGVCPCDSAKVTAEAGDQILLEGFDVNVGMAEVCQTVCGELEKDSAKAKGSNRRTKRQIGFGYGGFGWGGLFNGLPVGYGSLGFNLMGAGGMLGLGGCGFACTASPCAGSLGALAAPLAAPLPAMPLAGPRAFPAAGLGIGSFGLGAAAPLPTAGFDAFGASLGLGVAGFPSPSILSAGFAGGLGLGLGSGLCWGCQRNWLPAPLPVVKPVVQPIIKPITVPRYVDVPIRRAVNVPVVRPINVPVPRPVPVARPVDVPVVRPVSVPVVRQVAVARPVPVPTPVIRQVAVARPAPAVRRVIQVRRVLRLRPAVRRVQGVVAIPVSGVAVRAAQTGSTTYTGGQMIGGGSMMTSGISGLTGGMTGMSGMSSMGSIPVPTDAGAYPSAGGAMLSAAGPLPYPTGAAGADAATYYTGGSGGMLSGAYPMTPRKTQKTN